MFISYNFIVKIMKKLAITAILLSLILGVSMGTAHASVGDLSPFEKQLKPQKVNTSYPLDWNKSSNIKQNQYGYLGSKICGVEICKDQGLGFLSLWKSVFSGNFKLYTDGLNAPLQITSSTKTTP